MRMIPERRILLYVGSMIGGIIIGTKLMSGLMSGMGPLYVTLSAGLKSLGSEVLATGVGVVLALILSFGVVLVGALLRAKLMHRLGHSSPRTSTDEAPITPAITPAITGAIIMSLFLFAWMGLGIAVVIFQMARLPLGVINFGQDVRLTGQIEAIDGRADARLRFWLYVTEIRTAPKALETHRVRLSVRADDDVKALKVGQYVRLRARLYPPPTPVLFGAPDYGLQALARGIVASGFATSPIEQLDDTEKPRGWRVRLAAFRQLRADAIMAGMSSPAGGVAAALLIGDRRYVSAGTYDLFRESGLAHLLAISGLHMGLLCFGVIAFLRCCAALFPVWASRFPVHKVAACFGLMAGFVYVCLSGASISAVRAFLMAVLILFALLSDRLALTLRNVAIAAIVILFFNPAALYTAGFQLSFAATAALVMSFERRHGITGQKAGQASGSMGRFRRWAWGLMLASLIASLATLPFTAQHFGVVAPWGVLANLAGIPLTALWIMPAGLAVLVTQLLPFPGFMADASLWIMQSGIDVLIAVAGWFAGLPFSPVRVPPPGTIIITGLVAMMIILLSVERSNDPSPRYSPSDLPKSGVKIASQTGARYFPGTAMILSGRAMQLGMIAVLGITGLFWVLRPAVDGVYFAARTSFLLLPVDSGVLSDEKIYNRNTLPTGTLSDNMNDKAEVEKPIEAIAISTRQNRKLSDFYADSARRILAIEEIFDTTNNGATNNGATNIVPPDTTNAAPKLILHRNGGSHCHRNGPCKPKPSLSY
jgi:ComEC/Rec2-related protein